MTIHRLCLGGSKRAFVEVVPDDASGLYRVHWPDGELSDIATLSRCCDAARAWAEREVMLDPKMPVARRLKSLTNFSWSSSPIARNRIALIRSHQAGFYAIPEEHLGVQA